MLWDQKFRDLGWYSNAQPKKHKPGTNWDRDKVIAALKERKQQGLRMTCISKDDPALAAAARMCLESLREALVVAGDTSAISDAFLMDRAHSPNQFLEHFFAYSTADGTDGTLPRVRLRVN